jgi:poly(3-hydroxybutyrate) depolymerase
VETWKEQARKERTIVVLVGSVDAKAWNPEEVEVGARLVASVRQRFELQPHAVAVTGDGVGGTMALVASFLNAGTYSGVAVKSEVKPPAIQLRENDPTSPLHILVQGDQRPGWAEAVSKVGYAVLQGSNDRQSLFHYVWYLARI